MLGIPPKLLGLVLLLAGLILAGFGLSLLLSPPQFQATARIKVVPDVYDIPLGGTGNSYGYDPYFVQTTFEIIQSEVVLSNVVSALNLDIVWSNKFPGGRKLSSTKTIDLLKQRMMLAPVRNTKIIAISVRSDNPVEAAKIANAICGAYIDYREESRRQIAIKGLEVMQQEYDKQASDIQTMQTNLAVLRKKYGISQQQEMARNLNPSVSEKTASNEYARIKPFWDAKLKLEESIDQHGLFGAKLASERADASIPKTPMIQIVDIATPPTSPICPNRFYGAATLAIGLVTTFGGSLLLISESKAVD